MDKETLSNYGWIVICVMVLAVLLALASPFGTFVAGAIKSTTQGLFDVNQSALNSTGLISIEGQEFDKCEHDYEVTTTANCTTAGTTTYACKLCSKSYSEETPAGHKYDETNSKCAECGVQIMNITLTPSNYDAQMGTTIATDAVVVIPEIYEYNGGTYRVTGISGFASNQNLTSITLPKSLTGMLHSAFYNCTNLESVTLQEGLTSISQSAFSNCDSLKSITLPEGLIRIDNNAFAYCDNLESITLPDSLTSINPLAFAGCPNLTSITLPKGLTSIGANILAGCENLTSINYAGTMAQWNAITKSVEQWQTWHGEDIPATYVQCSDGQVPLS